MELILNELSFDGQFQSQDEFAEYVLDILIPVMDVIIENRVPLLKKSDIYNRKITREVAMLENNLELSDLLNIVDIIPQLIKDLQQGRKSKLWDKLEEDVYELRLHVSSNRIFRLLFVQFGGIQFLNGFIKKTQKTPPAEIKSVGTMLP